MFALTVIVVITTQSVDPEGFQQLYFRQGQCTLSCTTIRVYADYLWVPFEYQVYYISAND